MSENETNSKSLEDMFDEGLDMTTCIVETETNFPDQEKEALEQAEVSEQAGASTK